MRQVQPMLVVLSAALVTACGNASANTEAVAIVDAPTWSTRAPLPDTRTEVSVTTDGNRLYLVGGFAPATVGGSSTTAPRRMWVYDGPTDQWAPAGDIPEGVNHAGFVHLDGRLYIVGGFRETSFTPTGAVRIHPPAPLRGVLVVRGLADSSLPGAGAESNRPDQRLERGQAV